jgi:hypothetical protein
MSDGWQPRVVSSRNVRKALGVGLPGVVISPPLLNVDYSQSQFSLDLTIESPSSITGRYWLQQQYLHDAFELRAFRNLI